MDNRASPALNLYRPAYGQEDRPEGFRSRRARVGHRLGTERVGLSQFELPPGETAYPYHWHHVDEEIVIVLAGRPTLRMPDGERELEPGEIVLFRPGPGGAHQLRNDTGENVVFLSASNKGDIDVVCYPDTATLGIAERTPDGSGLMEFFPADAAVGYPFGEPPHRTPDATT